MKQLPALLSLTFFLLAGLFSCQENAQHDIHEESPLVLKLDSLFEQAYQEGFQGTVTIGNQEEILYQNAMGLATRVWELPNAYETRFDIASLNKSMIAGLVLLAVEEGRLSLDQTLRKALGNASYTQNFHPNITIHHLLTHTSGLADYDGVGKGLSANNFMGLKRLHFDGADEYAEFISELPTRAQPNQEVHYSNFAYHLLVIVLEKNYQKSFDELLQEKICKPLWMKNTFASTDNQEVFTDLAEAYEWDEKSAKWRRNSFIDYSVGRRVFSTSEDLYLWMQAMNDDRLLSKSSLDLMQENHLNSLTQNLSYGYGWVVYGEKASYDMGDLGIDSPYIIHGGRTEGFRSMGISINRGEWIITFLCNSGGLVDEMELATRIVRELRGEGLY